MPRGTARETREKQRRRIAASSRLPAGRSKPGLYQFPPHTSTSRPPDPSLMNSNEASKTNHNDLDLSAERRYSICDRAGVITPPALPLPLILSASSQVQSGCSAAWLARLTGGQKVEGSNPFTPTGLAIRTLFFGNVLHVALHQQSPATFTAFACR